MYGAAVANTKAAVVKPIMTGLNEGGGKSRLIIPCNVDSKRCLIHTQINPNIEALITINVSCIIW